MAELIEKIKISELTETTTADDASYIPIDNGNVTYKITVANYNSGANATAKSYSEAAAASATAAAGSATSVENALDEVQNIYDDFEDEKLDLLNQFSSITQSVQSASDSATSAATSATSAATSAQNCATIETSVREDATLAESWAVGGTNTRVGEDTDNAKYYAEQTQERLDYLIEEFDVEEYVDQYMAQHPAAVTSVNGARGDVVVNVPENTSDLTNDSGFITSADVPTKTSDLTNDSGFITDPGVTSFNGDTGAVTYEAPVTSVNGNTGAVTVLEDGDLVVTMLNVSSSSRIYSCNGITANHKLRVEGFAYLSNPAAVTGELNLVTSANTIEVRGTLSGTTNIIATFTEHRTDVTATAVS